MTGHLRDVQLQRHKPIKFHFGGKCHTPSDVAFTMLEKNYEAEGTKRQLREGNWIMKFSIAKRLKYIEQLHLNSVTVT